MKILSSPDTSTSSSNSGIFTGTLFYDTEVSPYVILQFSVPTSNRTFNNLVNVDITPSNIKIWNTTTSKWVYGGDSIATINNITIDPKGGVDGSYSNASPGLYMYTIYINPTSDGERFQDASSVLITIEVPNKVARYGNAINPFKQVGAYKWKDAALIYSIRLVNTSYTGPLIKVRRSSDDATLDIYPVIQLHKQDSVIDEAALLSFVGAGSGFIDTWYDQSGFGRNANQATTTNQPRIVNAGVIDRINTRPTVVFDGVSDNLSISATSIGQNVGYLSTYQVVKWTAAPTAVRSSFALATGVIGNPRFITQGTSSSKFRLATRRLDADAIVNLDTTANITTNPTLFFSQAIYTVPSVNIYTNGNLSVSATPAYGAGSTANVASAGIRIGSAATGVSQFFNGSMSEFILYNTAETTLLNVPIKAFYGIA
jgi:hypothetical protein